jgi:hypothetical protein
MDHFIDILSVVAIYGMLMFSLGFFLGEWFGESKRPAPEDPRPPSPDTSTIHHSPFTIHHPLSPSDGQQLPAVPDAFSSTLNAPRSTLHDVELRSRRIGFFLCVASAVLMILAIGIIYALMAPDSPPSTVHRSLPTEHRPPSTVH